MFEYVDDDISCGSHNYAIDKVPLQWDDLLIKIFD
jgi:hypothetical protein